MTTAQSLKDKLTRAASTAATSDEARPARTFFDMDTAEVPLPATADTEAHAAPPQPSRTPENVSDSGFGYNSLGLRSGGFAPSTHRAARKPLDIAKAREEQEERARRGLEFMSNLPGSKR